VIQPCASVISTEVYSYDIGSYRDEEIGGLLLSLRVKSVITASCALIVIVGLVCATSQLLLMRQSVQLDRQYAISYMHRVLLALEDRLRALDVTVSDWASWDDTYTFVQGGNANYVKTNLTDSTFTTLGINFLVFADRSGEIVFAKGFDLERRVETSIPDGLAKHLLPSSSLVHHTALESSVKGVLVVPEGAVLVASRPVLTSEREGPIQGGALVMGMLLNLQTLESLSQQGGTSLSIVSVDSSDTLEGFKEVLSRDAEGSPIFVKERDSQTISAYALIKDIYNRPALVVKADIPREIYTYARMARGLFLLYILAGGFVCAAIALVFLDRMVLARLAKLSYAAVRIGKEMNLSERLPVTGDDEIGELANTINSMLARIEEGQMALAESEAKYRTILEEMHEGYVELDLSGNIVFCNETTCLILGYPWEKLLGTHWQSYRHSDDVGSVYQWARQLYKSGKPSALFRCRLVREDKTLRYIETYLFPKRNENGDMVGFRVLMRDVTDRKLLEQQVIATSRLVSVGQLAAGIAHEVNNPLTGVIGYAQLLMARTDLPPEVKK